MISARGRGKPTWRRAPEFLKAYTKSPADTSGNEAGPNPTASTSTMRSSSTAMSAYASQQQQAPASRATPRLQNTQKPALGNGTGGWAGFGAPSSGAGAGATGFGGTLGGSGGSVAPALAAGPARPGQLSGFAQAMVGGNSQGPIDMSDFPSLSGGPRPQQNSANAAGWNSTAIRQPPAPQQQPPSHGQQRAASTAPSQQSLDQHEGQRQQQHAGGDRAEDFPPLGGQTTGDVFPQSNGFTASDYASPVGQPSRNTTQPGQLPIREASASYPHSQQAAMTQQTPQTQQSQSSQNGQAPPSASSTKQYSDMTDSEKWGLPGLMAAFESRKQVESAGQADETLPPAMRSTIVMGHDLATLGLDLDSPDPLYPTFTPFQAIGSSGSSFDFHDRHMVPDFTLPSAYTVTNVPPLSSRMSAFSDETLFSVFYQNPRDILQELAAQELINRDWRWHKILRQWLQKDTRESTSGSSLPLVDLTNGAPIGSQPIRKSERVEQGVYVFFDAMNWRRERRYLDLDYESLDPPRVTAAVTAEPGMNGGGGIVGGVPSQAGMPPLAGQRGVGAGVGVGAGRLMTELGTAGGQQSGAGGSSQIPGA